MPAIVHTVHDWSFHADLQGIRRYFYVVMERLGARCGHAGILVTDRDRDKGRVAGVAGGLPTIG
ncbi:hypothetical protein [Thioalkalivibrio paradoxus]|uniref:Uncharacterized protein n=1 Tax=Thioalkalivibrio paradoxus ARh 1 TaxID=713585 RepID=W0DTQ8_9GAMM|nr:hypothetical protein [Thioalkalivibrio paradoxus]AHF00246.1 hypothetical protein THITH_13730 [Thioalkalivibrio paradoxus ARh 1]